MSLYPLDEGLKDLQIYLNSIQTTMNRMTFYFLILVIIVGGYFAASKADMFKKNKGSREGFEGDDDDDDNDDASSTKSDDDRACKTGSCKKKKMSPNVVEENTQPPPPAVSDIPKNVITTQESSFAMDLQQIKDDVSQIKDILIKQERLKPQPPAFETFYSMNYY